MTFRRIQLARDDIARAALPRPPAKLAPGLDPRLWRARGRLPDDDRWPRWVASPLIAALAVASWLAAVALGYGAGAFIAWLMP